MKLKYNNKALNYSLQIFVNERLQRKRRKKEICWFLAHFGRPYALNKLPISTFRLLTRYEPKIDT